MLLCYSLNALAVENGKCVDNCISELVLSDDIVNVAVLSRFFCGELVALVLLNNSRLFTDRNIELLGN